MAGLQGRWSGGGVVYAGCTCGLRERFVVATSQQQQWIACCTGTWGWVKGVVTCVVTFLGQQCTCLNTRDPGSRLCEPCQHCCPQLHTCITALQCSTGWCCAVGGAAVQCREVQCTAAHHSAAQLSEVQQNRTCCSAAQHSAAGCRELHLSGTCCSATEHSTWQGNARECSRAVQLEALQCSAANAVQHTH